MYYFFFHKTPSMPLKRVIMILAASLEFEKKYNSEVTERQTDNEEVPHVSFLFLYVDMFYHYNYLTLIKSLNLYVIKFI